MRRLEPIKKNVLEKLAEHRANEKAKDRLQINAQEAEAELSLATEALQVAQEVAKAIQETVHHHVATLVSRCLSAVFDDPYEFKIIFETKRNQTEARMVFIRDNEEVDPMTASGGGVVEVAAFALRLASLLYARPQRRRLLVLDEPFKFVSKGYRARIRELVETLAEEMDVQFIIVTHIDELRIGDIIEIE